MADNPQDDLFAAPSRKPSPSPDPAPPVDGTQDYSAAQIEVLEGLEPVRKRPGMYVGGTDERALHHLFAEVLDNAMDEAVAGHADRIEIALEASGFVSVSDNGRGIPVDPHPRFPDKSALEVVMTTLHSGGKFSDKAYQTAGGLHGVRISEVIALSERVEVEVARSKTLWMQAFARGVPETKLTKAGAAPNRRGTKVRFKPDPEIFGASAAFKPGRLYAMARAKAFLRPGVEIRWRCDAALIEGADLPAEAVLRFPGGLADRLAELCQGAALASEPFTGRLDKRAGRMGALEWAVAFSENGFGEADGFLHSYCNTVPTPQGGAHEQGLRNALTKGLRAYGELTSHKKAAQITPDDVLGGAGALLSLFLKDPEFQGQTKERLGTPEAARLVETAVRDAFDHWLAARPKEAGVLLDWAAERAEERLRRKREKEVKRQSATRRLRLPGKLADCSKAGAVGTEIFLVEGDSAGGSAKQARDRATQAILPLRGKILNVASAADEKIAKNQEISDLLLALGVKPGAGFNLDDLRYDRVVIMTDADVDGAHIAALLVTFFYTFTRPLIEAGRLYLAQPPLFRLTQGGKTVYAKDEVEKDRLIKTVFKSGKVEVGRFKGLGEMTPAQLKATTMDPKTRTLARIRLEHAGEGRAQDLVEALMGRRADRRFSFIQENAAFVDAIDI